MVNQQLNVRPGRQGVGVALRSNLSVGNAASDDCYFTRNAVSFECWLNGWPDKYRHPKTGAVTYCCNNEHNLRTCLSKSGEANWWTDFAGCTSAEQCLTNAPKVC